MLFLVACCVPFCCLLMVSLLRCCLLLYDCCLLAIHRCCGCECLLVCTACGLLLLLSAGLIDVCSFVARRCRLCVVVVCCLLIVD